MSYTNQFKSRTKIIERRALLPDSIYPVALDIGYSAVKGMSPNCTYVFPSFTRVQKGEFLGTPNPSDIMYRDEEGVVYAVGERAISQTALNDTEDSSTSLYGRDRYYSKNFLIIARTGIALGLRSNSCGSYDGSRPIFLQTGLPPQYRALDSAPLAEALSGTHDYWVRVGGGEWEHFSFTLDPQNIHITSQPIGSLYSAGKHSDGSGIAPDEKGRSYLEARTLVFDGGFGTLDIFPIINRVAGEARTLSGLGMKAVYEGTANDICREHQYEVHSHTLHRLLEEGTVKVPDRRRRTVKSVDIAPIFERNLKAVFEKAADALEQEFDIFTEFDYMIVTGGTGAAWLDLIRERYSELPITIVVSNQNEPELDLFFSNVRGYYLFRAATAMRKPK